MKNLTRIIFLGNIVIGLFAIYNLIILLLSNFWLLSPKALNMIGLFILVIINQWQLTRFLKNKEAINFVVAINIFIFFAFIFLSGLHVFLIYSLIQVVFTFIYFYYNKSTNTVFMLKRSLIWAVIMGLVMIVAGWGIGYLALKKSKTILQSKGYEIQASYLWSLPLVNIVYGSNFKLIDTATGEPLILMDKLKIKLKLPTAKTIGVLVKLENPTLEKSSLNMTMDKLNGHFEFDYDNFHFALSQVEINNFKISENHEPVFLLELDEFTLNKLAFKIPSKNQSSAELIVSKLLENFELADLEIKNINLPAVKKDSFLLNRLQYSFKSTDTDFSMLAALEIPQTFEIPGSSQGKKLVNKKVNEFLKVSENANFTEVINWGDYYDMGLKVSGKWADFKTPNTLSNLEISMGMPKIANVIVSGLTTSPPKELEYLLAFLNNWKNDPLGMLKKVGFNELELKLEDRGLLVKAVFVGAMVVVIKDIIAKPDNFPKYALPVVLCGGIIVFFNLDENYDPASMGGIKIDGQGQMLYPFTQEFIQKLSAGTLKTEIQVPTDPTAQGIIETYKNIAPETLKDKIKNIPILKNN